MLDKALEENPIKTHTKKVDGCQTTGLSLELCLLIVVNGSMASTTFDFIALAGSIAIIYLLVWQPSFFFV